MLLYNIKKTSGQSNLNPFGQNQIAQLSPYAASKAVSNLQS